LPIELRLEDKEIKVHYTAGETNFHIMKTATLIVITAEFSVIGRDTELLYVSVNGSIENMSLLSYSQNDLRV